MQSDKQNLDERCQESEEKKNVHLKIKKKNNNIYNGNQNLYFNDSDRFQRNSYYRNNNTSSTNDKIVSSRINEHSLVNNQGAGRYQRYIDDQIPSTSYVNEYDNNDVFSNGKNNARAQNIKMNHIFETNRVNSFHNNVRHHNNINDKKVNKNYYKEQHNFRGNNRSFPHNQNSRNSSSNDGSFKNVYRNNGYVNNYSRPNYFKDRNNATKRSSNIDTSKLDQRESLIHELNLSHYECMICMNVIQKEASIWSCEMCFHLFHLHCINKWAQSTDKKENTTQENQSWRCPACQNENKNIIVTKLSYTCFCGKLKNPTFKQGTTPHSCGDVCAKTNQSNSNCPHLCSLQCHPGPCPPCEASLSRQCHCGRTRITAKCTIDETQFRCESICDKIMQCGLHKCKSQCHINFDDHQCQIKIEQKCWCGCSMRTVLCGSQESLQESYECGEICGRLKNCGNHKCEELCHSGECEGCETMPEKVHSCYCGKKTIQHLSEERKSCLDPIPSCGAICERKYPKCDHSCINICHVGKCSPCIGTSQLKCRCENSIQTVLCASTELAQCKQRCKEKLLCGRHRCDKQCCDSELHLCELECGRMLSCKEHRCDRECGHPGLCPSCPNVSFEELFCECQATFILPPIACGQSPPLCNQPCTRDHNCDHPVRHNCHTESKCPPCTELMTKPCPGGHTEYANVPCFRPVTTCGQSCGQPLSGCEHSCVRPCHGGPCVVSDEVCTQSCLVPRKECGHPCLAPCHSESVDCDQVMTKCSKEIILACECSLRSSLILCHKLQSITSMLRSERARGGVLDVILSATDGRPYLACTGDCKKAARNSRMAEVMCGTTIPLCLVYTYYPDSVKDFGARNKPYVVSVQNVLVRLVNGLQTNTGVTLTDSIPTASFEQSQFAQRYADCFKMKWSCASDQRQRTSVLVEATRGVSRPPKPLLTEVLREKYPHLFVDDDTDKDKPPPSTNAALTSLSFADRLKLNTK